MLRVRALVDAPEVRMPELEREIQLDPVLATRIVGVANSPFYGAARPAASVGEAVVRLGLRQTRHLVQGELERGSRGQARVEPEAFSVLSDALHPALGAMLADAWSLAPAVIGAISHHHDAASAPEPLRELARIAAGADAPARLLPEPGLEVGELEGIDSETVRAALEEARESYAELSKLL